MTRLPIHPRTGLTAIGTRRDGRPIWPVMGGDGTTPPPAEPAKTDPPAGGATPPATDPAKTDPPAGGATPPAAGDGLGEAGKKALEAERNARKDLEKQLAALAPLKDLAAALNVQPGQGKTDVQTLTEQVAQMQRDLADERLGRLRLEVAAEKGLSPAQAARLQGKSREELAKDADDLKTLFPGTPAAGNGTAGGTGTPRPDPTQGARGGANELQAQLKAAQEKGDTKAAIRIKTELAAQQANTTR